MHLTYFQTLSAFVCSRYFIIDQSAISLAVQLPYCSLIKIIQTTLIQGLIPLCSVQTPFCYIRLVKKVNIKRKLFWSIQGNLSENVIVLRWEPATRQLALPLIHVNYFCPLKLTSSC